RRVGVNAMHVLRTALGDRWAGQAPMVVGSFRGPLAPADVRVLELETSDEQAVAVLTTGAMRLCTVDKSRVRDVGRQDEFSWPREVRGLVGSVLRDEEGNVPILEPDAVKRARDRLPNAVPH